MDSFGSHTTQQHIAYNILLECCVTRMHKSLLYTMEFEYRSMFDFLKEKYSSTKYIPMICECFSESFTLCFHSYMNFSHVHSIF